jgi:excisionase family DNA binding protein
MERLLTVEEVSNTLKVGKSTIYRWVYFNYIPYLRIGGVVRFDKQAVRRWFRKREKPGRSCLEIDEFLRE